MRISNVKRGSARATWMAGEASTTMVRYGRTMAYGKKRSNTNLVVRHVITLGELSANTRYHYRAESRDEAARLPASTDLIFKTVR